MLKKIIISFLVSSLTLFSILIHARSPIVTTPPSNLVTKQKIIVWQHTIDYPNKILMSILLQALDLTREQYGDYEIISSLPMEQRRAVSKLSKRYKDTLDIAHLASNVSREKNATAIRIPLISGLSGYRVCLIKPNNQAKFTNINNKQDFINKGITIGQQQDWPDTKILTSNGINVQTSYKYSLLFRQLDKQRFDCFLRGINEISDELELNSNTHFVIENNLLFYYPLPLFFFVNNNRPELIERLTKGLTILKEEGVLADLLATHFQQKMHQLQLNNRTLIRLDNPILSSESLQSIEPIPWLNELINHQDSLGSNKAN
jgi:hypothetical protein